MTLYNSPFCLPNQSCCCLLSDLLLQTGGQPWVRLRCTYSYVCLSLQLSLIHKVGGAAWDAALLQCHREFGYLPVLLHLEGHQEPGRSELFWNTRNFLVIQLLSVSLHLSYSPHLFSPSPCHHTSASIVLKSSFEPKRVQYLMLGGSAAVVLHSQPCSGASFAPKLPRLSGLRVNTKHLQPQLWVGQK